MLKKIIFLGLLLSAFQCMAKDKDDGSQIQPDNLYPKVKIETTMGDFVIELNRYRAPITTNNFLRYVDKRAYEDTIFHRIIPDFVVQGGGYDAEFKELAKFPPIYNESGNGLKNGYYSVAMARGNDPHSANRQFYINMGENDSLDPGRNWGYAVFGEVVEGNEVLDAMSLVQTHYHAIIGWADVPVEPVLLKKATILPPTNPQ